MYFRLNPECFFIKGERCGAIYDLIEGNVYALSIEETKIIESCEKNNLLNNSDKKEEEFLKKLRGLCLGNFYDKKVYIEKLRIGSPIEEYQPGHPPKLNRVFLEINNSCNRDCWFCGYYGIHRSLGCMGCNKWNEDGKPVNVKRWKNIIDQIKDLDCRDLFITGGDLTLSWNKAIEIVDYAKGKFTNLYLTVNEHSLTEDIINDIRDKAQPIIQITCENLIKSNKTSWGNLNPIFLVITRPDESENLENVKGKKVAIDFVDQDFNSLPQNLPLISEKKIPRVNIYQFSHNLKYHPCIGNTLSISHTGNVLPCPMLRNHVLGNVRDEEIYTIFEKQGENIDKFWHLTLDKIEKCGHCEFRYACNECRALEERLTGELTGKKLCNYLPEEGKWTGY